MYDQHRTRPPDASGAIAAPSECPACRSSDVKTTSKNVSAESYWRCLSCGEVWNVGRREPAQGGRSWFNRYR